MLPMEIWYNGGMKILKFLFVAVAVSIGKIVVSFAAALVVASLGCLLRAWATDWEFSFPAALRLTAFAWLALFDWAVVRGNRPLEYGERRLRERVFYWTASFMLVSLVFCAYRFYFKGATFGVLLVNVGFAVLVIAFDFVESALRFVILPVLANGRHEKLRHVTRAAVSIVRWIGVVLLPIPLATAVMCALAFVLAPLATGRWVFMFLKCLLGFGAGVAVPMLTYWIAPSRKFNAISIMVAFEVGYLLASFVNQQVHQLIMGLVTLGDIAGDITELAIHFCGLIIGVFLATYGSKRKL